MPPILAFAAISLCGCASTETAGLVEQGYERGALGVAAIGRKDWKTAEANLQELRGVSAGDPARLINLGRVYFETGRPEMARSAWRLALASDQQFMVETADGTVISTKDLAEKALAMHEQAVRSAAR